MAKQKQDQATTELPLKKDAKVPAKETHAVHISTVGRRRSAVARIRLYTEVKEPIALGDQSVKKGDIYVNGLPIEQYFSGVSSISRYQQPLQVTNTLTTFAITAKVVGGGKSGQLDAVVHGIARALAAFDKTKFRPILKKKGLLTRDPRTRERRKVGMGGKARRKKQSPKR